MSETFSSLVFIFLAVIFLVSTSTASYLPAEAPGDKGKLKIVTLDSKKLEAIYYDSEESGIHIISEVNTEGKDVKVLLLAGEVLVSIHQPKEAVASLTIMGHQFLIVNNTSNSTELSLIGFAVPRVFSRAVTSQLKRKKSLNKVLRHLDFQGANSSKNRAVEELLTRPEIALTEEAAEALGNQKIVGRENPAVMAFYVLAMRLTKFREGPQWTPGNIRGKRSSQCSQGETYCSNSQKCSKVCPLGPSCTGMCGNGCNCWAWLCGSCDLHVGCYSHDICCGRDSSSWGCLLPFGFSCDRYYSCNSKR